MRITTKTQVFRDPGVLDEPFSRLDQALRAEIRAFVFAQARQHGIPTLLVTHGSADAEAAAGTTITLGPS